jgi:anti-sigma B factor antagonist
MDPLLIRDKDDVVVVSFNHVKILDADTIRLIGQEFKNLSLQAAANKKLLLDFSRVEFMTSAMIGEIVKLHKQCKQDKIRLKLCNICSNIMEVFKITGLSKLLEIHADGAKALEAFGPPAPGWNR